MCSTDLTPRRLGQNIKQSLDDRNLSQKLVADAAGITEASMSNYALGKRVPDAIILMRIAQAIGVSVGDLLGEVERDIQQVPVIDAELGAGPGGTANGAAIIDHVGLPSQWLRHRLGIEPRQAFLAPVRGVSMPGIVDDGDLALGGYCETIDRPGIYAAYHEQELLVKHARMVRGEGDTVCQLLSSHESYPPINVHACDDFHVIGRIRGRITPVSQ